MEEASPTGPSAATEAAEQAYHRLHQQAAAPLTSLAQAQALLAELLTQQQALLLENQHLRTAQQQLTSSENRLKATEAVAGMGSYELEVASGVLHFSEGLYQLFGEAPGSFTPSRAWLDARSRPEDGPVVAQVLDEAIRTKQPYRYTRHLRRADGAWRTLEWHGRVVCDAAGTAIRVEGVVEDQTDRQRAAHALRAAEDLFQLFVTASVDVVYKMSADWRQMYQLAGKEFLADTRTHTDSWLHAYIPAADQPAVAAVIARAIETKTFFEHEHRVFQTDGTIGWVHSRAAPVCSPAGDIVEWVGTASDITARKQAEQEWATATERLRATLDSSLYVVQAFEAVRDEQGHIVDFRWVFINQAAVAQHGEVVGKSLLAQNPGVVETGLFALFVQVTETGVPVDQEHHYPHEQFNGWFHQTMMKMGDGFVLNTEDITERRKATQELQASRELLRATIDSSLDMLQVFEAVRNEHGDIVDFRWTLNNQVSERIYGDVIGQRLLAHNPGVVEAGIFDTFKRVVATGVPDRREHRYTSEQFDGWFYQSAVKLRDGVATTTADISKRKRTEQEILRLQQEAAWRAEDKYHTLFNSLDECFCVLDLQFDAQGHAVDWIYREANPAFERQTGYRQPVGQRISQLQPDLERSWFERFAQVVRTGEPTRFTQRTNVLGRWFDVYAFRVGTASDQQVALLYTDVSERKQQEQQQAFRLRLQDALRPLHDPVAIQAAAVHILGENLGLSRAFYAPVERHPDGDMFVIDCDFHAPDVASLVGRFPVAGLRQQLSDEFSAGRTVAATDLATQPLLSEAERVLYPSFQAHAYVSVPLVKDTRLAALLTVHQNAPRQWQATEIALLEETAERIWTAVARARTEQALRASEERHAYLLKLSDALRPLADAVAIQETVAQVAREFFQTDRCYYGELADGQCLIRRDASAEGLPSVAGLYDLATMPLFRAVIAAGQPFVVEDVHTSTLVDDSLRQLYVQLQVISFINIPVIKNGQPLGVLCVVQSTPRRWTPSETELVVETAERTWAAVERARAEDALHESEERFRNLVEAHAQAVWETDPHGVVVRDSPSWRAYTGQTEAAWLGDGWLDAIHPDDRLYAEQQWRAAVAAGRNIDTEFRLRCAASGYCWTNIRATPIRDATGHVRKWAGMNIDIDPQKRASESLRRSKDRLRLAIEAAELATWDWDLTTNEVRWNARHFTLFGMVPSPYPVTPADFERHLHPDDRAAVIQLLQAAAAEHTLFQAEFRIMTEQGDLRWLSGHGQPTSTAPDGRALWMSGVVRDITDRKRTEQQQLELAAALERRVARRTQALQASKDLQEAVFNTVRHAITVFKAVRDEQGQIIDFAFLLSNGVADRHMQLATAGKTLRTVTPGYIDEDNFRRMVQVVETGRPTDAVLHFTFGAQPIYLHTQYNKLGDGLVLVHEDITQRLAAERAIQDSRDLLQSVYDTSLVGMAVLHAVRDASGIIEDFTFVSVNQELTRATGRPDLVGRRYAQEFPGGVPSGSLALMARAVETGEPQQHEHFYPYEGVNRWYSAMYVQLDDGVVATTLDITERKQAEQELRSNLGLLEQSEQVAQLGSWEYELATGVLRWSEGMYHLFDLPPGTPVQPTIYLDYTIAADRPVAERVVRALTTMPADFAETLRLQVGEQEKTVRLKAVVQRDAAGQPARVLGVDLDISQVQRLEADNLRLRLSQQQALFEAVQEAQEEERRRLSESLHNGIGQILYATKLQLDRLPDAPEAEPRREAARLLGEAIRQTRALSHELTPAMLEEFGLEKTLQSICSTLNTPGLHWRCHLVLEEAAALPMPLQLAVYRLAQELAQNVLKHAQATEATLEVEVLPGWVVLRVEDNGRGFDPTHTSDGLGLRSLRSRVALLSGQVHLTTAPQEGTQFQLRIPLAPLAS